MCIDGDMFGLLLRPFREGGKIPKAPRCVRMIPWFYGKQFLRYGEVRDGRCGSFVWCLALHSFHTGGGRRK